MKPSVIKTLSLALFTAAMAAGSMNVSAAETTEQ